MTSARGSLLGARDDRSTRPAGRRKKGKKRESKPKTHSRRNFQGNKMPASIDANKVTKKKIVIGNPCLGVKKDGSPCSNYPNAGNYCSKHSAKSPEMKPNATSSLESEKTIAVELKQRKREREVNPIACSAVKRFKDMSTKFVQAVQKDLDQVVASNMAMSAELQQLQNKFDLNQTHLASLRETNKDLRAKAKKQSDANKAKCQALRELQAQLDVERQRRCDLQAHVSETKTKTKNFFTLFQGFMNEP